MVYVDGLKWPTGVIAWDGGVFVAATPDIWYCKDADGDGAATGDEKRVVFTGFGESVRELNVQALVNGLTWGPDGRIFGATGRNGGLIRRPDDFGSEPLNLRGADFSFDPRTLEMRREPGTAQQGLTFDEYGQRYVCSNSRHLIAVMYGWPWNEEANLPNALVDIPVDGPAAEVYRTSAVEPWRAVRTRWRVQGLVRGPIEGGGRDSGYFTSASGLEVYRGDAFPEEYYGNVFVGDVGSNLVHRKIIERPADRVALAARRAEDEQEAEFLTSMDNWFRPVQCANGPDGALYVVDMYRETIEHPRSLPETIKARLDLNSGNDRGRIWRIVPVQWERPEFEPLDGKSSGELRDLLESDNGWTREAASRVLAARGEDAAWNLKERGPAWKRFDEALGQLKDGDAGKLRELLAASRGDEWIGPVAAAAAKKHGLVGEVFGGYEDLAEAAALLEGISFSKPGAGEAEALRPLFDRARASAGDPAAVRLLGMDPRTTLEELWAVVDRGEAKAATAAFEAVRRRDGNWEAGALERWATMPGGLKSSALRSFGTEELLDALEGGAIRPSELDFAKRRALRDNGNATARKRAAAVLGEEIVVSREEALKTYRPALVLEGDLASGEKIFTERCAVCHVPNAQGVLAGPGVDSYRNQGKAMLLENLLQPNREVAPQYFVWEAELKNGAKQTGILVSESATDVTLRQTGGIDVTVKRSDLVRLSNSNMSLMTPGLEAGLTVQQMADLLAYLKGI